MAEADRRDSAESCAPPKSARLSWSAVRAMAVGAPVERVRQEGKPLGQDLGFVAVGDGQVHGGLGFLGC